MSHRAIIAILALASVAFSGCIGGSDDAGKGGADPNAFTPPTVSDTHGAIQGAVATTAIEPIQGAVVELLGPIEAETTTPASGDFKFEKLSPGAYKVTVKTYGHLPQAKSVQVQAGKVSEVQFLLEPLASTQPWHDLPAHHEALFMECQTGFALTNKPATPTDPATDAAADAIEPVPLFGFDPLVDGLMRGTDREFNESRPYGLSFSACSVFEGTNNDRFQVLWSNEAAGVEDIVVELDWSPRSASARTLSMTIEPCLAPEDRVDASTDEEYCYVNAGYDFARLQGTAPLKAVITKEILGNVTRSFNENETVPSEADPLVTKNGFDVAKPQDFAKRVILSIRIFTVSDAMGEGYPADYALSVQQPADLYVTRFFNAPAPEGFSGIPDA